MSRPFGEAKLEGKAFEALGKIKKNQWKEMKGAFGQIKGAATSFSPLMKLLGVMKFFKPILKPLNALLKVLMASIFKPLMPLFQVIGKMLMGLMPLIQELGTTIGTLIAGVLERIMPIISKLIKEVAPPLIRILIVGVNLLFKLMPLLDAMMPIIMILVDALVLAVEWLEILVGWLVGGSPGLIPALEGVVEIIEILVEGAITILISILEFLGETMEHVGEVINMLISGAITILITTFEFLGKVMININKILKIVIGAFQFLGNLIKDVILGVIDGFVRGMEAFAKVLESVASIISSITGGGGGGGGGKKKEKFLGIFQEGTPFVPETGFAHLTRGEAVIPARANPFARGGEPEGKTIVINMNFGPGTIIADEYSLEEFAMKVKEIMFMELD